MLLIGIILLLSYKYIFKLNINKTMNNQENLILPDLNDLVIAYIIFSILVIFIFLMVDSKNNFHTHSGTCITEDVTIDEISSNYKLCLNKYNNVIFTNQEQALKQILTNNEKLIKQIIKDRSLETNEHYDELYYSLQQRRRNKAEVELYLLLDIYRNYYETTYQKGR